jgi:hypothetical protein
VDYIKSVLLAYYSHTTRILLAYYSHTTRILLTCFPMDMDTASMEKFSDVADFEGYVQDSHDEASAASLKKFIEFQLKMIVDLTHYISGSVDKETVNKCINHVFTEKNLGYIHKVFNIDEVIESFEKNNPSRKTIGKAKGKGTGKTKAENTAKGRAKGKGKAKDTEKPKGTRKTSSDSDDDKIRCSAQTVSGNQCKMTVKPSADTAGTETPLCAPGWENLSDTEDEKDEKNEDEDDDAASDAETDDEYYVPKKRGDADANKFDDPEMEELMNNMNSDDEYEY